MFFLSYVIFVFALLCFICAGFLLLKRHKDAPAVYLALITLCAGVWALGNAQADFATTTRAVLGWTMVASAGFIFFATFFVCFVVSFKRNGSLSPTTLLYITLPSTILYVYACNPLVLDQTMYDPLVLGYAPSQISFGPLYLLVAVFVHALFAFGIVLLFVHHIQSPLKVRLQILYIVIGASIALVSSAVFDVALPLLGENRLYNIGPLSTGIMIVCLAYAIIRHRLFDIRVIVQKSIIYTGLLSVVVLAYLTVLELLGFWLELNAAVAAPVSAGVVVVLGVFTVTTIENFFRKVTDSIFFKEKYNYAEALQTLSKCLDHSVEVSEVTLECEQNLLHILRAQNVTMLPFLAEPLPAALTIPIVLEGTPLGTIFLEEKRSGEPYTKEDKQLLETFAHQAAIALGRALLYAEVKQHAAELEQKVMERTHELQKTQEGQKQMMLDISHGLQTPLTIFQTKLEQLKKTTLPDVDIHHLETSLGELSNFIHSLLQLAVLENKKEVVVVTPVCLTSLLAEILEEVETIAATKSIAIRHHVAPDVYVEADSKKIREVVMNLASNAIKYMAPQGTREIIFSLSPQGTTAALSVADTGVGMTQAEVEHIFERFYRAQSTQESTRGAGLGLAISKRIIEQYGGTLTAESTFGVGTTMTVSLPSTPRP